MSPFKKYFKRIPDVSDTESFKFPVHYDSYMKHVIPDMYNPFELVTANTKTFVFYVGFPWRFPTRIEVTTKHFYNWNRLSFFALLTKVYEMRHAFPEYKLHSKCFRETNATLGQTLKSHDKLM